MIAPKIAKVGIHFYRPKKLRRDLAYSCCSFVILLLQACEFHTSEDYYRIRGRQNLN